MSKKILTALVIVLRNLQMAIGQVAPGIEWQNTIGGSSSDFLLSIEQTTDGGYILGGRSWSNISGDKTENRFGEFDYWIIKVDSIGNIQWQNDIGGTGDDILLTIHQTTDGGYIIGGYSSSDISGDKTENNHDTICDFGICTYDYWIVKVDSLGNILWQNTIGGNGDDMLYSIELTSDGGFILGGYSYSWTSGDKTEGSMGGADYWIVKTDSIGNVQWQNTIGGNDYDQLSFSQQTNDGGYILGGYSSSNTSGDKTENNNDSLCNPNCTTDYWIVKTDATGNIQWQNTIGGSTDDVLYFIRQTTDNGYILSGKSRSNISGDKTENCIGDWDYWMVKTDFMGNIQWQNTIGGSAVDILYSIHQTQDSGYILGGWSYSNISGDKTQNSNGFQDYWAIKTDSLGSIQWQKAIGGNDYDELTAFQQTSDGGYILSGGSNSNISADKTENSNGLWDYWIIKLYPDTITGIYELGFTNYDFQLSPNPFADELTINLNYPNTPITLSLFDIMGKEILSQHFTTHPDASGHKLQTSNLAKGIYFLKLNVDGNIITKKVMKM